MVASGAPTWCREGQAAMAGVKQRGRDLVRRGLLRASNPFATVTSPARLEPTFLIVGAQRCGTTSMFKTLVQHPDVAPPFLRKGIHYFDKQYDRPWSWYRGHFPLRLSSKRRNAQTGESSPYYMFHPNAGHRIARDLPEARLIMLVRDPVERAYSAHAHERARGFETLEFADAIEAEHERVAGERERMLADPTYDSHTLQHNAYCARGRYIEQIEALVEVVGPDRLLVVDSGDFFTEPESTFESVRAHLGLRRVDDLLFERHNARPRTSLSPGMREQLLEYFEPWDAALARWWGRTPSWRR